MQNNPLDVIESYLEKAEVRYMRDFEKNITLINLSGCLCAISVVQDYWVYIFTCDLLPKPIHFSSEMGPLCYEILRLNNYSKMGRFYIDEEHCLEFAVDMRLEDLNEAFFLDALYTIDIFIAEKLPPIIAPYLDKLENI